MTVYAAELNTCLSLLKTMVLLTAGDVPVKLIADDLERRIRASIGRHESFDRSQEIDYWQSTQIDAFISRLNLTAD